jgi:hypothetical protein
MPLKRDDVTVHTVSLLKSTFFTISARWIMETAFTIRMKLSTLKSNVSCGSLKKSETSGAQAKRTMKQIKLIPKFVRKVVFKSSVGGLRLS